VHTAYAHYHVYATHQWRHTVRMFEVEFYGAFPNRIVFAENRQAIWKKYKHVRCIHRIEIV
jgi:hypothetical protein